MFTVILHILFLQAAGAQTVASKAACDIVRGQLNCSTFPIELICGSNGVEYPTHCDFAKFHCDNPSVHIALYGPCAAATSPRPTVDPLCDVVIKSNCPKGHQVCGSDGKTYLNLCSLHKEACIHPPLAVAHKGPCGFSPSTELPSLQGSSTERLTVVSTITTPMTTQDKVTTTMPAAMTTKRKETTTKAATTTTTTIRSTTLDPLLCQAILVVVCGNELNEICGSDGKAYRNRCEFQKGVCKDSGLKEESLEKCPTLTNPPTTQTTTTPTTAIPTTQTTPDVTITLDFLCQAVVGAICPVEVKEVCGGDGKTYKNICRYQKAKCYFPNLTVTTGPCKVVDPTSTQQATSMMTTPITSSQQVTTKAITMTPSQQVTSSHKVTTKTTTPVTSSQQVTTNMTTPMPSSEQQTTKMSVPMTTTEHMTTKTSTSMTTTPALSSLCQVIVSLPCSGEDRTCATDGKVYANKCEYSKAKCHRPTLNLGQSGSCTGQISTTPSPSGNLGVLEVICGALKQAKCEDDPQPLCASNNVTYDNECEFEKAKCNNKTLHVLRFQPCL